MPTQTIASKMSSWRTHFTSLTSSVCQHRTCIVPYLRACRAAETPHGAPSKSNAQRAAEIENSKYLGGDMEHTHLVKGLDFALLNKVRTCCTDVCHCSSKCLPAVRSASPL